MEWLKKFDTLYFVVGRSLLGIYFIVPGLGKIFDFMATLTLMRLKECFQHSALLYNSNSIIRRALLILDTILD